MCAQRACACVCLLARASVSPSPPTDTHTPIPHPRPRSMGIAVGSSIQIGLLAIPLVTIVGWATGHSFSLAFDPFSALVLVSARAYGLGIRELPGLGFRAQGAASAPPGADPPRASRSGPSCNLGIQTPRPPTPAPRQILSVIHTAVMISDAESNWLEARAHARARSGRRAPAGGPSASAYSRVLPPCAPRSTYPAALLSPTTARR